MRVWKVMMTDKIFPLLLLVRHENARITDEEKDVHIEGGDD